MHSNYTKRILRIGYSLGGLFVFTKAIAKSNHGLGIGDVAVNMLEPVGLFSDFIFSACFLIGASFLFASIIKYVEHKRSPLMVPISTVIFLLIAGIVLILLPFTSYITDSGVRYALFK